MIEILCSILNFVFGVIIGGSVIYRSGFDYLLHKSKGDLLVEVADDEELTAFYLRIKPSELKKIRKRPYIILKVIKINEPHI